MGDILAKVQLTGEISLRDSIDGTVSLPNIVRPASYKGEYTITPTHAEQVIPTAELYMLDNLTVNPIPSNYGLITWNGATLTVS